MPLECSMWVSATKRVSVARIPASPCSSSRSCLMQHSTVNSTIWHIPFPHNPLVIPLQKELIWSVLAVGRRVGEAGGKSCSFLSASPQVFKKGKLHHYLHCSPAFKIKKEIKKEQSKITPFSQAADHEWNKACCHKQGGSLLNWGTALEAVICPSQTIRQQHWERGLWAATKT